MEQYKIKIFPAAINDLLEIVAYVNTLSPDAALRYYDMIVEKIGSLSTMPERCPFAKDRQIRLRGYRTMIVKNYIVFYIVNGVTVEVRRILYARRQYEDLI